METAALTVIIGLVVFVGGQIALKFLIEPINRFWEEAGEIAYALVYYAQDYANPGLGVPERMNEASDVLRQHAGRLSGRVNAIWWYKLWQGFKVIPNRQDVLKAIGGLTFLSNSFHAGDGLKNGDVANDIQKCLWIQVAK